MDFATRAWNHSFPFDPIVRSLLDTDFYKLLMQQFIWEHYPNERVTWRLTNRTKSVRLADEIELDAVREQLDHVRTLRFTPTEIVYLRGQSFYGQTGIFKPGYLDTLRAFRLPDYELSRTDGRPDRARLRRPLVGDDALGDIRPRHRQRASLAGAAQGDVEGPARHPLRPGQGEALRQARAAARARRPQPLRLRNPPPPRLPVAGALHPHRPRAARRELHRHLQRLPGDEARPRGQGHQRPRAADGVRRPRPPALPRRRRGASPVAVQGAPAMAEPV